MADFIGSRDDEKGADGIDIDPGEEVSTAHMERASFDKSDEYFINPTDKTGDDDDEKTGAEFLVAF